MRQKHAWFQHIATHVAVENSQPGSAPNEWLEPVTDEVTNCRNKAQRLLINSLKFRI